MRFDLLRNSRKKKLDVVQLCMQSASCFEKLCADPECDEKARVEIANFTAIADWWKASAASDLATEAMVKARAAPLQEATVLWDAAVALSEQAEQAWSTAETSDRHGWEVYERASSYVKDFEVAALNVKITGCNTLYLRAQRASCAVQVAKFIGAAEGTKGGVEERNTATHCELLTAVGAAGLPYTAQQRT